MQNNIVRRALIIFTFIFASIIIIFCFLSCPLFWFKIKESNPDYDYPIISFLSAGFIIWLVIMTSILCFWQRIKINCPNWWSAFGAAKTTENDEEESRSRELLTIRPAYPTETFPVQPENERATGQSFDPMENVEIPVKMKSVQVQSQAKKHTSLTPLKTDYVSIECDDNRRQLSRESSLHSLPPMKDFDDYLHLVTINTPLSPQEIRFDESEEMFNQNREITKDLESKKEY